MASAISPIMSPAWGADDAAAQDLAVAVRLRAVVKQQLGEALVAAVGDGAARGGPGEQTLLDLDALWTKASIQSLKSTYLL